MNIIVLDGHTLNPGDLSWDPVAELGELTVHERTEPELVIERMGDGEIALTNKTLLSREIIERLPRDSDSSKEFGLGRSQTEVHDPIDRVAKKNLAKALERLRENPRRLSKKLTLKKLGSYRYRVGNYRVIFDIEGKRVIVHRVGHRKDIYR